ncbi:MAG: GGDEF domain-containing protein [Treponema sp.]|nr:GGDEF domain-containing protein [Treponema sp.]
MSNKYPRIGFLINDETSDYNKSLIRGIEKGCREYNCTLFVFPAGEYGFSYSPFQYQSRSVASLINEYNLDGLIITSSVHCTHISFENLLEYIHSFSPLPVISLGIDIPNCTSIMVDCKPGLEETITHLIKKHNCKRIALMASAKNSIESVERVKVFKDVMNKNNIPFDESHLLYGLFSYAKAMDALNEYIKLHGSLDFDSIVCLNDLMAYAVLDFCKEHSISIPDQMIVTGFDDLERSTITSPTLSSINQNTEDQGVFAVQALSKIFNKKEVSHLIHIPTLVRYRQSCGCIDCNDHFSNYKDEKYKTVSNSDAAKTNQLSDWLLLKDQLVQIQNYYTNTQVKISLSEFSASIPKVLTDFSIGSAALVMFEKPIKQKEMFLHFNMPKKAYLLAAFDNSTKEVFNFDTKNKLYFNPNNNIIPEDIITFYPERYNVVTLSHCEIQFGYLVYKTGFYEPSMYQFITAILSAQLATAYDYSKAEAEKQALNKNNKFLQEISRTDDLTHVLNRRGYMNLGQDIINVSLKQSKTGLVIFGDMDGLKTINDTYGHDAGDRAIIAEAEILQKVFRASDVIGRIGGDEFAIVAPGLFEKNFQKIKSRVTEECDLWNKQSGEVFSISISLGFTEFNSEHYVLGLLLQEADEKQYEEKRLKKEKSALK